MRGPHWRLPAVLFCLASCSPSGATAPALDGEPELPELPDADVRVIFVGNSLLAANDLPGMVASLSAALGRDVATLGVTADGFSLQDHVEAGVLGLIRRLEPDLVVLQQGPSALPESQVHLQFWADSMARGIRAGGGSPAVLMAWPELDRWEDFPEVLDAYAGAATRAGAVFLPAGEALRLLQEREPLLSPFGADGFHPTERGSVLAALVVLAGLLEADPSGLPQEIGAAPTGRAIVLSEREASLLPALALEVVERFRAPTESSILR